MTGSARLKLEEVSQHLMLWQRRWANVQLSTEAVDYKKIARCVGWLYDLLKMRAPQIVHCKSPWQAQAMPYLLQSFPRTVLRLAGMHADHELETRLRSVCFPKNTQFTEYVHEMERCLASRALLDRRRKLARLFSIGASEAELALSLPSTDRLVEFFLWDGIDQKRTHNYSLLEEQLYWQLSTFLGADVAVNLKSVVEQSWGFEFPSWTGGGNFTMTMWGSNLCLRYAWMDLLLEHLPPSSPGAKEHVKQLLECCRGLYMLVPYKTICFVSDRPEFISLDDAGRLHNELRPAMSFADGFSIFAWHGVRVPAHVIMHPENLTCREIDNESNAAVRRVMIERYGQERYLIDSNAMVIHQDERGILYQVTFPGDEPLVMVQVQNSTAEPDGTYKDYFMRVPPDVQTVQEAIAWTFGLEGEDYKPDIET